MYWDIAYGEKSQAHTYIASPLKWILPCPVSIIWISLKYNKRSASPVFEFSSWRPELSYAENENPNRWLVIPGGDSFISFRRRKTTKSKMLLLTPQQRRFHGHFSPNAPCTGTQQYYWLSDFRTSVQHLPLGSAQSGALLIRASSMRCRGNELTRALNLKFRLILPESEATF